MAYKGLFTPQHPEKYKGDPSNIVYRSRWELVVMSRLDAHPDVIQWSSEEIVIQYISPIDGRFHRYYPDFWVRKKDPNTGEELIDLIEIKPYKQTQPPAVMEAKNGRRSRGYLNEVMTWGINSAKWKAARIYCENRGWNFVILTERELQLDLGRINKR